MVRINQRELLVQEITDILDELQERLEESVHDCEVDALKGSYGVYLHDLRRKDQWTAHGYIEWMREYNRTHGRVA